MRSFTTTTSAPAPAGTPASTIPASDQATWTTYDGTSSRGGVDTTAPPAGAVRSAWTTPVLDGDVYAQPIVAGQIVYVATEDDTVYAFDRTTGQQRWMRHLANPEPGSDLPCGNISPSGITGTPVADPSTGVLWVVSFETPGTHTLWGLSLATGAVLSSRNAEPPGADPLAEQERGALALYGSTVYIPYGGLFGDCSDYHGWVVGMSASNVASDAKATFQTPTSNQAGIWAPPGPVLADGSVWVATGNGMPFNAVDDSDSVLRLSPGLNVQSSFTPSDYEQLSAGDLDLGSTSPAILPDGLVFQAGKQGVGYLLLASDLGGVGGQLSSTQVCSGVIGGTAVDGDAVFVDCYDGLSALKLSPGPRPALSPSWSATGFRPGPPIVAGGCVWAVSTGGTLYGWTIASGQQKYAFPISVAGDFPSPAAALGYLYVPDGDRLEAFSGI